MLEQHKIHSQSNETISLRSPTFIQLVHFTLTLPSIGSCDSWYTTIHKLLTNSLPADNTLLHDGTHYKLLTGSPLAGDTLEGDEDV